MELLLRFHDNNKHFYMVHNYILASNSKKGTYCYVSMITVVRRSLHTVTIYVYYLSCSLATCFKYDTAIDIFL